MPSSYEDGGKKLDLRRILTLTIGKQSKEDKVVKDSHSDDADWHAVCNVPSACLAGVGRLREQRR